MQQIRKSTKQKSVPKIERFLSCKLNLVRERGLEPPRPKTLVPETSASTNSATRADVYNPGMVALFHIFFKRPPQQPSHHTPGWAPKGNARKTECGPFGMILAYGEMVDLISASCTTAALANSGH